jgi:hypothetical protein
MKLLGVRPMEHHHDRGHCYWQVTSCSKWAPTVKMIAEYLEHALQFERMAASEKNPELKAQLEKQAAAYRKLAGERANKLGLQSPPGPKKNP